MTTCTFFGHRDAPSDIMPDLRKTIIDLIENKCVEFFLVGDNGNFDMIVKGVLTELQTVYDFKFQVVLSQIPMVAHSDQYIDPSICVVPDGIESALPRFRIDFRNKYMLNESDYVIAYIVRSFGGAAKYFDMAIKKNKKVINIAE